VPAQPVPSEPHDAAQQTAGPELEALVVRVYQLALDRAPNADELRAWTNELQWNRLSAAGLVETIASSPEAEVVRERTLRPAASKEQGTDAELEALIVHIYRFVLERTPNADERQLWANELRSNRLNAAGLIETIASSQEAEEIRERSRIVADVPNGKFIQFTYDCLLARGAMADEIAHWDYRLIHQSLGRDRLVLSLFSQRAAAALTDQDQAPVHDPTLAHVMGTDKFIGVKEWQQRALATTPDVLPAPPKIYPSLAFDRGPEILVSAIASLYRGGDYIEQFLENITSQTIFVSCELIIIDADSPENEYEVIASYMKRFPNIVYHRAATRIGIYEAWNLGVEMSRGRFITNTNLDDLRRSDSFERQVEILKKFPFVDVVYQDFWYSFDGMASVERTAAIGIRSEVPIITPYNLIRSNSPHNAPMWRRELHQEVGMFDASYRSAGDYDFWLRCVQADKVFYKVNDPHVVYFVNPEGLSTQPNTRGIDEANRITRKYGSAINSPWLLSSDEAFLEKTSQTLGAPLDLAESERSLIDWRYGACQKALRACSIASRAAGSSKE
jgi:GT2 family glycosyltransferase